MKHFSLSGKLAFGFGCLMLISVGLGTANYYSAAQNALQIHALAEESLPSVEALLTIKEQANAIKAAMRTLLSLDSDPAVRRLQPEAITAARAAYGEALKKFEVIPRTPESDALWPQFQAELKAWREANNEFLQISGRFDKMAETFNRSERGKNLRYRAAMQQAVVLTYEAKAEFKEQIQEWKNILIRGHNPEDFAKYLAAFNKREQTVQTQLTEVQGLLHDLGLALSLESKQAADHLDLGRIYRLALRNRTQLDAEGAKAMDVQVRGMDRPVAQAMDAFVALANQAHSEVSEIESQLDHQLLVVVLEAQRKADASIDKLLQYNATQVAEDSRHAIALCEFYKGMALVVTLMGLGGGVVLAWLISRSITKPINEVAAILYAGADQTSSAAGEVTSASQSLAQGSSEQAASIEETSATMEEMTSMTKHNVETAHKANQLAKLARAAAEKGGADVQSMSAAMGAINASSTDIAKIIKTIDEIAFQTNILALNAAVEAARAGEAGAGFAVVAEEVRTLAQRCAQAAKETSAEIESAISKTAHGVEISERVAHALVDIVSQSRQVDELVAEMTSAAAEQSQSISQVGTTMVELDRVTQNNAASAEETAAAAEQLHAQALSIHDAIEQLMQLVSGRKHRLAAMSRQASEGAQKSKVASASFRSPTARPATAKPRA